MLELLLVVGFVLLSSGFFSCSEAALLSITHPDVDALIMQKKWGSYLLSKVHKHVDRSIIAIVIMNNIANIVGSILVGQIVINTYGSAALAVASTGLTFGVIVFAEIIPKSLGVHYNESVALRSAPIIYVLTLVLYPIILLLEWLTNHFKQGERKIGTEAQIRSLVTMGRKAGHIETDEGQLIHRAFILNDKQARDSMTDLKDIIGVQHDMNIEEALEKVQTSGYSRFPVFGDSIHEIEGIVLKNDMLQSIIEGKGGTIVAELKREPLIVDAETSADELMMIFRTEKTHLAVVQEDDHTVGIISLEDVLEELVGDIEDETDAED